MTLLVAVNMILDNAVEKFCKPALSRMQPPSQTMKVDTAVFQRILDEVTTVLLSQSGSRECCHMVEMSHCSLLKNSEGTIICAVSCFESQLSLYA